MELVWDIFADAVADTLKLVPFLFVTYWAMEWLEHRAGQRSQQAIRRAGAAGPAIGALLGALPQCGFSAAASTLYAGRVVTLGTLFAVYLSTSDEMLPIFLAEGVDVGFIVQVVGLKVLVGMAAGFAIDAVARATGHVHTHLHIHELCESEGCACDEDGHSHGHGHGHAHAHDHDHAHGGYGVITRSAAVHTLQVAGFIFLVTLALGAAIEGVGEQALAQFMQGNPVLAVAAAATVGLIPNCGASVVVTQLYLEGTIGFAPLMAGLLVGAGVGLLVLVRTNRRPRENAAIIAGLWAMGLACGFALLLA